MLTPVPKSPPLEGMPPTSPDSTLRVPNAYGTLTANVADFSPASSAYDVS